jgi:hypothetical protein
MDSCTTHATVASSHISTLYPLKVGNFLCFEANPLDHFVNTLRKYLRRYAVVTDLATGREKIQHSSEIRSPLE